MALFLFVGNIFAVNIMFRGDTIGLYARTEKANFLFCATTPTIDQGKPWSFLFGRASFRISKHKLSLESLSKLNPAKTTGIFYF